MDILDNIIPILIFIGWVLVSIFASTKKRRNQGRPAPRQENPTPYESGGNTQTQSDNSSQMSDELRRTLETIFGDKETAEERVPTQQREPEQYERDSEPVEQQNYMDPKVLEEQAAIKSAFEKLEQKKLADEKSIAPPLELYDDETNEDREFSVSSEELKKGILWAEILGRPVSMRT